ncbi:CAP domain-containing protein [Maribacter halichondriae]|uniref:CAP domain-containing protein n=1 Tax=Maribacter halichondriae TaxID=2980554 RepID=UPI00235883AE|nr:CAP domain-containing protein [Maribacter sp. Hal144]
MPTLRLQSQKSLFSLTAILFFIISCSKDGDVDTIGPEEIPVDLSAKEIAQKLYNDYYVASKSATEDNAWTGSEAACDPGSVPQSTKEKIFTRLAYFRKAAGLHNEITENLTKSDKAQRAALMMHANNTLDHFPPESWKCYSTEGKDGAGSSLLTMSKNAEAIDSYVRDYGANNGPVGHRRWLLWPRLQEIGIGNTNVSNAIWVLGNAGNPPTDAPDFIAWPPEGYVPNRVVYPRWSFSIKDADFTATQISMKDADGNSISLSVEELDDAYGDSTIVWVPEGIESNNLEDIPYIVTIKNVKMGDDLRDFEYHTILFDIND